MAYHASARAQKQVTQLFGQAPSTHWLIKDILCTYAAQAPSYPRRVSHI